MNIIEERRRKAWSHAAKVIFNKVTNEAIGGTLYIYADRIYGKGCNRQVRHRPGGQGHPETQGRRQA